ncbi:hypothetical protein DFH09DRAFT_1091771 [Mycena vulgaris]|nr:hypothetical protein DFH09DRAFT_1091771 [Mycena vulgaris]
MTSEMVFKIHEDQILPVYMYTNGGDNLIDGRGQTSNAHPEVAISNTWRDRVQPWPLQQQSVQRARVAQVPDSCGLPRIWKYSIICKCGFALLAAYQYRVIRVGPVKPKLGILGPRVGHRRLRVIGARSVISCSMDIELRGVRGRRPLSGTGEVSLAGAGEGRRDSGLTGAGDCKDVVETFDHEICICGSSVEWTPERKKELRRNEMIH